MCTVSYIPIAQGYLLTSSRDEQIQRETVPPRAYRHTGKNIIYPRDARSGGTWIAACSDETVACLLNGAFEKHQKKPIQVVSRGKMVLESLEYNDFNIFVKNFDFNQVEPFTLITVRRDSFFELKWNGESTLLTVLDKDKPKIWSSPTLYSEEQRIEREKWFYHWLSTKSNHPDFDMMGFHSSHHGEDKTFDILMNRPDGMQTVSITQIGNSLFSPSMIHVDLKEKKTFGPFFYTI